MLGPPRQMPSIPIDLTMMSTDPDKISFTPPSRVKMVTITIVAWATLAWTLFVFVNRARTIYNGFECEPNLISQLYIWAFKSASNWAFPNMVNAARFVLAGISFQVIAIEIVFPCHSRITKWPRLQRVLMWLLILMPLLIALIGASAIGIDIYSLIDTLS